MPRERNSRPITRRIWWIWVTYWALLFVVMHVPLGRDMRVPIRHGDKALHVLAYFLLTWLGGCYLVTIRRDGRIAAMLVWGAIYVGYAALDEWLQGFVGRTASLGDWCGDVLGVVLATIALLVWHRWPHYRNPDPPVDRL